MFLLLFDSGAFSVLFYPQFVHRLAFVHAATQLFAISPQRPYDRLDLRQLEVRSHNRGRRVQFNACIQPT